MRVGADVESLLSAGDAVQRVAQGVEHAREVAVGALRDLAAAVHPVAAEACTRTARGADSSFSALHAACQQRATDAILQAGRFAQADR